MFGLFKKTPVSQARVEALLQEFGLNPTSITVKPTDLTIVLDADSLPENARDVLAKAQTALEKTVGTQTKVRLIPTRTTKTQSAAPTVPPLQARKQPSPKMVLPVPVVIAVASGKGGVGKSTVAANLAVALALQGKTVGLLDADIYGPSQPKIFGVETAKPTQNETHLNPVEAHGVKLMSIGFMLAPETPLIWRGPMVQSALKQMLQEVDWQGCDVLLIDLPPGTGDTQLTLVQQVPLTGAIIVTTPQDLALLDARKGLEMFRQTNVPVLGLVENMSVFCCPNCGHTEPVFGVDGGKNMAETLGVPFLGALPLDRKICTSADQGIPLVAQDPASPLAQMYSQIAGEVWVGAHAVLKPAA